MWAERLRRSRISRRVKFYVGWVLCTSCNILTNKAVHLSGWLAKSDSKDLHGLGPAWPMNVCGRKMLSEDVTGIFCRTGPSRLGMQFGLKLILGKTKIKAAKRLRSFIAT